jgi:hypothetical protein
MSYDIHLNISAEVWFVLQTLNFLYFDEFKFEFEINLSVHSEAFGEDIWWKIAEV